MDERISSSWDQMWERLDGWLDTLITNLPNIALAIAVFIAFYWISVLVRRVVKKPLVKVTKQESVRILVMRISSIVIVGLGFLLALGIMNLDTALKSILAGAGVAGLAVGLALQGTLSNTFSGMYLAVKDIINIGDWIESNGFAGTVEKITLRNTFIKEPDNNLVVLPNKMVLENPFKNYGLTTQIRVILECGVEYGEDLERVKDVAIDAIHHRFHKGTELEVEFYYTEFGGSSINFMMRFWVDAIEKMTILGAKSESIMTLKKAFDAHDISIPFPIRTLDIKDDSKDLVRTIAASSLENFPPNGD
jgi:small conductance mechanosensitive channel